MGTSIRTVVEVKTSSGWEVNKNEVFPNPDFGKIDDVPRFVTKAFDWQNYGAFGFFAGVRNYSETIVLSEPRGLPDDSTEESMAILAPCELDLGWGVPEVKTVKQRIRDSQNFCDYYDHSWLSAAELLSFDYDQNFTNQREEPPLVTTYRDFLGELYFAHLEALKKLDPPEKVRILFCFCC